MNIFSVISEASMGLILLFALIPALKKRDHHGIISYVLLLISFVGECFAFQRIEMNLLSSYLILVLAIFMHKSKFGTNYYKWLSNFAGPWLYLTHITFVIALIVLMIIDPIFKMLSPVIIVALVYSDYCYLKKKNN